MYPTIHNFDTNPLHASAYPGLGGSGGGAPGGSTSSTSSPGPSSRPLPASCPLPPRANGPPPPPSPAFPTLRVTIDPRFQVAPPVRAPPQPPGEGGPGQHGGAAPPPPPGHPAPGGSGERLDLDLERRMVEELASSSGSGGSSSSNTGSATAALQRRDDPYEVLLARYTDMGYTREQVAMALAVVGPEHSDDADKIVDACRKFKRLCSMGLRPEHVAGALIMHGGDVEAAAATCLDATG